MALSEDATITSKGQVTIPKRVRDALDLEPGEEVEFVVSESGELRLRRKRDPMDRLREVRERLAPLEVDVAELRRQSKAEWDSVDVDE
jgi:AbrB family looped-hinge helix DNA binding protein